MIHYIKFKCYLDTSLTHSHPPSTHTHEREEIRKEEHRKKKRRGEERGRKERKDEEIRRGCSVAAETPPPLLGLVAFVVLPPSGCCSAAKELEGSTPCHQFEGAYDFDSDDELQWLIEIEKVCTIPISSRYNDLMLRIFSKHPDLFPEEFEHFDDFTIASSWERFISKIEAICRL
ncbi:hypothetical protein Ahy_A07g035449 isoform B [Arachis hypogaea]|uniref:Uncharacterized protein n=1 Tax=Arachis hypogaea TaxID=3818 RepID=A0A445CDU9_ARAHY|nr:hypothetical protein Ahy_A07g035449 isoform B [Arachis hypogaea]